MSTPSQLFTNNAVTLLASPISNVATSLTVMAGYGTQFPQPVDPGDFFLVTLEDQTATTREIIKVTSRSGDTFSGIMRAQEGTTAQAWSASLGNDTLVDHRVTAETMRQALLQPTSTPADITVQDHGSTVTATGQTLNFAGDVTVTSVLGVPTIDIGAGSATIQGASVAPVSIDPGFTLSGSTSTYAENQRGFKFFVTITMPFNHLSETFEVLGNISGNLSTNSEVANFNRSARVGHNFDGTVDMQLNVLTKEVKLVWTNNEPNPVVIQCVRIQHTP